MGVGLLWCLFPKEHSLEFGDLWWVPDRHPNLPGTLVCRSTSAA